MGMLGNIDHVVVLMLENRSFDSMLGTLYPKSPGFEGLSGTEANLDANGVPIPVWNKPGTDVTTMSGFARNYAAQAGNLSASYAAADIMHCYTPDQVPVISRLAREFAVCDC